MMILHQPQCLKFYNITKITNLKISPSRQAGNLAKNARSSAWMNKGLLTKVKHRKGVYVRQKQGQVN